uniref:Uncharacterized protein n=1 Tax=Romanomermis culicivorax TaxID=13658 RepID=A0A915I2P9_ROMCU
MPPASASLPTINPSVNVFRNITAQKRRYSVANCMKWAPFKADSLNKTPLLPTKPTVSPYKRPKPVTKVWPYLALNSSNFDPSTKRDMISRTS